MLWSDAALAVSHTRVAMKSVDNPKAKLCAFCDIMCKGKRRQ